MSSFLSSNKSLYEIKEDLISLEGDDYQIFNVFISSKLEFAVEPDNGKVWRIWVYGEKFKTEKDIGVGNSLGDIRSKYSIDYISIVEGNVVVSVKEISVTFILENADIPKNWWKEEHFKELSNEVRISQIIVT